MLDTKTGAKNGLAYEVLDFFKPDGPFWIIRLNESGLYGDSPQQRSAAKPKTGVYLPMP